MRHILSYCLAAILTICCASQVLARQGAATQSEGGASASMSLPPGQSEGQPAEYDASYFAVNLFREAAKGSGQKNLMISPFSVSTCLTMAFAGAEGGTREAMAKVLGLKGTDEQIFSKTKEVLDSLRKPGGNTQLEIANALYGSSKLKLKEKFLSTNKASFNAEINTLDFNTENAVQKINSFVSEQTRGKIPTIVQSLDPSTMLVLINAIYFKGTWEHKFTRAATKPVDFHLLDGGTKKVMMMTMPRRKFQFSETADYKAIRLPYADGRLSMYIFLPSNIKPLKDFEAELTPAKFNDLVYDLDYREGDVKLPRFKLEDSMKMNDVLAKLGMAVAFQPKNANFLEIAEHTGDDYLYISDVLHKTFMEVNEEGTEAAAVTGTMMAGAAAPERRMPFVMIVDHPFVIAIRDERTNSVLFIGHIVDPPGVSN